MVGTFALDLYRGHDIHVPWATRRSPTKMSCSGSVAEHRRSIEATFAQSPHASKEPEKSRLGGKMKDETRERLLSVAKDLFISAKTGDYPCFLLSIRVDEYQMRCRQVQSAR